MRVSCQTFRWEKILRVNLKCQFVDSTLFGQMVRLGTFFWVLSKYFPDKHGLAPSPLEKLAGMPMNNTDVYLLLEGSFRLFLRSFLRVRLYFFLSFLFVLCLLLLLFLLHPEPLLKRTLCHLLWLTPYVFHHWRSQRWPRRPGGNLQNDNVTNKRTQRHMYAYVYCLCLDTKRAKADAEQQHCPAYYSLSQDQRQCNW